MQSSELTALREQLQSKFERGQTQRGLAGKEAGTSGLEVKEGSPPSAAARSRFRDPLEEFGGTTIFAFVEYKDGFLQNRGDILSERSTDLAAKHTTHEICSFWVILRGKPKMCKKIVLVCNLFCILAQINIDKMDEETFVTRLQMCTKRESQVISLFLEGKSNKQIALQL